MFLRSSLDIAPGSNEPKSLLILSKMIYGSSQSVVGVNEAEITKLNSDD